MCEYKVKVMKVPRGDNTNAYITEDSCLTHNKKLHEYSVVYPTTTMFDTERFRREELDKLSRKSCEFWSGYYTFESCSEAIKVKSGPHPLSPDDHQLIVECDAGHKRNFLYTKAQIDMLEQVDLLEHKLKEYKTCGDVTKDDQLLLLNVKRPDSQEDEFSEILDF